MFSPISNLDFFLVAPPRRKSFPPLRHPKMRFRLEMKSTMISHQPEWIYTFAGVIAIGCVRGECDYRLPRF